MAARVVKKTTKRTKPTAGRGRRVTAPAGTSAELRAAALLKLVEMIGHQWPIAHKRVFQLPSATLPDADPQSPPGTYGVTICPETWFGNYLLGKYESRVTSKVATTCALVLNLDFDATVIALARVARGELVPGVGEAPAEEGV